MPTESEFWQRFKRGLDKLPGLHMTRIENAAGSGISDVSACYKSVEVWLELKVFHGNRISFRNSQRIWISRRVKAGGKVLIVAEYHDTVEVYPADYDLLLFPPHKNSPDNRSFTISRHDLPKPMEVFQRPIPWEKVLNTIFFTAWR